MGACTVTLSEQYTTNMTNKPNEMQLLNILFLRACFPTALLPTARYFGLCLGGVTFSFKLSDQFLRAVPKMHVVGRKNDTDRTKKI